MSKQEIEYVDIVDENNVLTGKTKLVHQIHLDGDWHRTAHVWILNDQNELLVQKRSKNMYLYPNYWDVSAAGHIKAGETSLQTAMVETEEELGLQLNEKDFKFLFTIKQIILNKEKSVVNSEFNDIYLVKGDYNLSDFKLDPVEVKEIKFMSLSDIKNAVLEENSEFVPHLEEYQRLFNFVEKISKF